MSGKKYFDKRNPKGEVAEWKSELADKHKQKDALKKIIAAMTIGKDVSAVFAEVTSCGQTSDLELKKLVYLYLINYAKTQPELAIMAVNTFVKDANDTNPMLRALAIRTMGCIRVDRITEYLCEPLEKALKDQNPYVRKTAAICVAKLYDMSPELVIERGFLESLREMTNDANPMVVSNAVAALAEISDINGIDVNTSPQAPASYLLTAMEQCTEWGQVYLLECLAAQEEVGSNEAETLIMRVMSRLQHANSAVVLAAVKVILNHIDAVTSSDQRTEFLRKLSAPLVTLLSQRPEIQYVALRNINLILQKYPSVLSTEARVFFCKYNDPIYVKLEKLEIMVTLANEGNITGVLAELKEYAQEVDVDFVRKSVSCIGQVAIRLGSAAQQCMEALLELVKLRVGYVVQEAVVVIKDIFRCYPNKYEAAISELCSALDQFEEPEAKAAMIWIVGEYAERIDNADELLGYLLDTFLDEPVPVQLQLLTATVKLFLKKPGAGETPGMISSVLTAATQQTDNPDLRDRAFFYWRMLSAMPESAQQVVLAPKPTIKDTSMQLDPSLRDELLRQLSTLASVYHKLPRTFVRRQRAALERAADLEAKRAAAEEAEEAAIDASSPSARVDPPIQMAGTAQQSDDTGAESDAGTAAPAPAPADGPGAVDLLGGLDDPGTAASGGQAAKAPAATGVDDLLGGLGDMSVSAQERAPPPAMDPFGMDNLGAASDAGAAASAPQPELPLLADTSAGHGCEVRGKLLQEGREYVYHISLRNCSPAAMTGFHVQFNRNRLSVGLPAGGTELPIPSLQPGQTARVRKPLAIIQEKYDADAGPMVQLALRWAELTSANFVMLQDTLPVDG